MVRKVLQDEPGRLNRAFGHVKGDHSVRNKIARITVALSPLPYSPSLQEELYLKKITSVKNKTKQNKNNTAQRPVPGHNNRIRSNSKICKKRKAAVSWLELPMIRRRVVSLQHSSGAVWESRWPSWAVYPNELSGFRGRKELLNRASALVTTCP